MSIFTYIKTQLSILELAREYTTLTRAGHYWRGRCPLHNERTASFTISEDKQIFYCFGCVTGGDIVTLVSKKENCSPLEAAYLLIERYGLKPPESTFATASKKDMDEKKRSFTINELLAQWCHENLSKNAQARLYLTQRGFNAKSIQQFCLGYFPGGLEAVNSCLAFMRKHSILAEDLLALHILVKSKNVLYSPFEDRIIFPIRDHLKRTCGFGGRIFRPDDTRVKYYNSRENPHFIKGTILFGFDLAKQAIQKTGTAFLVEGYTDCITMVQHGFANTFATLGTACTQEHLTTLSRYAQRLYVVYDGDRAGQDAIMRLTKLCWLVDMELYAITLPAGQDPASLLSSGASLDPFIEKAQDIFTFFINKLGTDFSTKALGEKISCVRQLLVIIASLDDPLKQSLLLDKASQVLKLPVATLSQELKRLDKPVVPSAEKEAPQPRPLPISPEFNPLEKKIFSSILHTMQLLTTLGEHIRDYLFNYLPEPLNTLTRSAYNALEQGNKDFFTFFDALSQEHQLLVSRLIADEKGVSTPQEFVQLLMQLKKRNWKTMVQSMKEQVAHATKQGDNAQAARVIQEFVKIKERHYTTLSD